MAGAACSGCYTRMVKYRRCPGIGGMAIIALVVAGNVLNILADGNVAIVTARATADYLGMVYPNLRAEEVYRVTILTDVGGFYMLWVFAQRRNAVVAAGAVCCNGVVVKGCRAPGIGGVTIVTPVITLDMLGMFAGSNITIVATGTPAQHLVMVHPNLGAEEVYRVAIFTDVGGFYVLLVFAECYIAVVATGTVCSNRIMVEVSRCPGVAGVAIFTVIVALDMQGMFAGGNVTIVAA